MFRTDRIDRKLQSHLPRTSTLARTGVAKAGKRRGGFTEPPAPSDDNLSRRIMGEQQFVAKRFPSMPCTCCPKTKRGGGGCAYDSGMRWDKDRKQLILPPKMAAKMAEEAS